MKRTICVLLACCLLLCSGCTDRREVDKSRVIKIYNVSNSGTMLESYEYEMQSEGMDANIAELLVLLAATPSKLEYKPPLTMGFQVLDYEVEDGRLNLNMDDQYRTMKPATEVLVRAALVRIFTQLEGVDYVSITVNGSQLHDSLGNVVGLMAPEQFIDNAGTQINGYELIRLKLYFANEEGNALVATYRNLRYNTNVPLEKLVMEQLITGPDTKEVPVYPTINPDTKLISIAVKDATCYVNLNDAFLSQIYNVSADVAIYSIVNSLIELTNVNKVQISVDGETNVTYRETYNLTTVFERNLDVITTLKE